MVDDQEQFKGSARIGRWAWSVSALFSLGCLIALGTMWVRAFTAPLAPAPAETVVTTQDEVTRYLDALTLAPERGSQPPIFIPTGLYIESLQFKGPYGVQVSGYVWQRYANDLPKDLDEGFVMPEAQYARFFKVYQTQQGNEELIGWSFFATLREQFDYREYPLDRQQVWIELWHKDFDQKVYLAPDLEGYAALDPAALPALDRDVVLEDWDIEESYFSYRAVTYNSDFGIQGYEEDQKAPELRYVISIKRHLLSALISRMIVPLVILLQLFVLVVVIGTKQQRLEQFGVRPGGVIFTCAAFFFATLVAHNSLRGDLKAYGLVYLESLYILTYFVILAVAINSVLLVAQPNLKLFREYDNLWAEVLYWPTILSALVVITFLTFR
jgi:hypothetical protein